MAIWNGVVFVSNRRPYGPANNPNQSKTRSLDCHRDSCTTTAATPIAAMMDPRITSGRSPRRLDRNCSSETATRSALITIGPSSTFLLNHMAALRDPESGNNNYLSFTRSEHLDSIAGPPREACRGDLI